MPADSARASTSETLSSAALGVLAAVGGVTIAALAMGFEQLSWWAALKVLVVPAVAALLRPPKREGVVFLCLFGAGACVFASLFAGEAWIVPHLAFGVALFWNGLGRVSPCEAASRARLQARCEVVNATDV